MSERGHGTCAARVCLPSAPPPHPSRRGLIRVDGGSSQSAGAEREHVLVWWGRYSAYHHTHPSLLERLKAITADPDFARPKRD